MKHMNRMTESGMLREKNAIISSLRGLAYTLILILILLTTFFATWIIRLNSELNDTKKMYDTLNAAYSELASKYEALEFYIEDQPEDEPTSGSGTTEDSPSLLLTQTSATKKDNQHASSSDSAPLSSDIKSYLKKKCDEYGFDYPIMLGLIRQESGFNPNAVSSTGDYGLCQINKTNHKWMKEVFGSDWDPLNAYDSIDASLYILNSLDSSYNCKNYHILLMNYNLGHGNAKKKFSSGIYSTQYSRNILQYAKEYGYTGNGNY